MLGGLAALGVAGAFAAAGIGGAARLLPDSPARDRLAAAIVVAWTLSAIVLQGLAAIGAFRLVPAGVVALALALALRGPPPADLVRAAAARLADLPRPARGVGAGLLALYGLVAARAVALPPLGWDALVYHLPRAAFLVQDGTQAPRIAPHSWGAYEFYPAIGDFTWAWAMLGPHDDRLVGLVSVAVAAAALPAAYALARAVDASPRAALGAAATLAATPALVGFAAAAYVDSATLLAWLLGGLFLARFARAPTLGDAALAGAALGLCAGTKTSGIALFALGVLLLVGRALRAPGGARLIGVGALAALPGLGPYARALWHTGSPLWPLGLTLWGVEIFPHSASFASIMDSDARVDLARTFGKLFLTSDKGGVYVNLGPAVALAMPFAAVGAWRLVRTHRLAAAWLLGTVALIAATTAAPSFRNQLVTWIDVLGRLLLPAGAALLLLAARGAPAGAWVGALALQLVWCRYLGVTPAELPVTGGVAAILAAGVVGAAALRRTRVGLPGALAAVTVALLAATALAAPHRYAMWRIAVTKPPTFVAHPLPRASVGAAVWEALDGPPATIAFAAARPAYWFRYPLLGSRLQHRVVWVAPTADGRLPPDNEPRHGVLDMAAWIGRLRSEGVDHVVIAGDPPEADWVSGPCFVAGAKDGKVRSFRFICR